MLASRLCCACCGDQCQPFKLLCASVQVVAAYTGNAFVPGASCHVLLRLSCPPVMVIGTCFPNHIVPVTPAYTTTVASNMPTHSLCIVPVLLQIGHSDV